MYGDSHVKDKMVLSPFIFNRDPYTDNTTS